MAGLRRIPHLLALIGALCAPSVARAQAAQNAVPDSNGKGFDTHLFRPALDSKGFFSVNGSNVLGANDFMFGLVIDYGNTLLRARDFGQKSRQLLNHSFQGTGIFNYGLFNRFEVGVSAPVNLIVGDEQVDKQGQPTAPPPGEGPVQWGPNAVDSQNFSTIALHTKWRITRAEDVIGLAISAQAGVPVSDTQRNGGADPAIWYWPQAIAEKRIGAGGFFRVGVNVGFRGHDPSGTQIQLRDGRFRDGNRATFGGAMSIRPVEPLDLVAETYGTWLLADADRKVKLSNEVVGGIKLFVEKNSYLMLGAGARYTPGFEAANLRGFIGFVFEPSIGDRDGDGIPDDIDKCPDDPEDFDGFEDEDGCPDPDNDKDGIPDKVDRCPNEPEDFDGDEDKDGCPESRDLDRDGDGIPDARDKCPNDKETVNGFQDDDGCPDQVPQKLPPPPPPPPKDPLLIQDNKLVVLQKIQFMTNSAEILPASGPILDAVATTLQNHPEFLLMEIAGHADERADDRHNLRLTQARVTSVMNGLVNRGVAGHRLRSKGYGEYCPEDPGHTPEAWERNRRVEFKVVRTLDGPTNVELGCPAAAKKGVKPDPVQ